MLSDIKITENEDVFGALVDAIEDNGWVERDFYVGDKSRRLSGGSLSRRSARTLI
ncbi:hypothetical protein J2X45_001382 [Caulobacter sp. BE264]|uniref:hypothetical protein n=1 Tax=Caulobacter sp. BE264 TaxID=2817724 RepID=UPI00285925BB|nr:hypothetical protein [Caulobacter sp. BE264]MDR7230301.1 hypothetical protein [Caulobacter sp. BE264]